MGSSVPAAVLFVLHFAASRAFVDSDNRSNIIVILTDDQDVSLDSMRAMPRTIKLFGNRGSQFTNAFVTSPICCPSRASILTGRYAHNHNMPSNLDGECYTQAWIDGLEKQTVGRHLKDAGYETAYFGKYMNNYRGHVIPPGWDTWMVLAGNSKYYNYTLVRYNSKRNSTYLKRHGSDEWDYFPTLMTRKAIRHMQTAMTAKPRKPFFMILSYPSPHGSEDAAAKYQEKYLNIKVPRNPNFNNGSHGKHWFIRYNPPLTETEVSFIDLLYRKRLQTLHSVDDAIHELFLWLWLLDAQKNTYVFLTSDHGYHLGQFGLLKGKGTPYEDDIRVPFFAYGPRIPRQRIVTDIVLNIDLTPTCLDIAQVTIPETMDGESILQLFPTDKKRPQWRTSFLIERYKASRNQRARTVLDAVQKKVSASISPTTQSRIVERAAPDEELASNEVELSTCLNKLRTYKSKQFAMRTAYYRYNDLSKCVKRSESSKCKKNGVWNCSLPRCPEIPTVNNSVEAPSSECMQLLREKQCHVPELKCVHYSPPVWKTPPTYQGDSFCRCSGAANDSYWCERRIGMNENYLYCVFLTKFEEYYNLQTDNFQLENLAFGESSALTANRRNVLLQRLKNLTECKGAASCSHGGT